MRRKVLVISFSPLHRDPRVLRQLMWLRPHFDVTAAGFSDPAMDGVTFVALNKRPSGKPLDSRSLLAGCAAKMPAGFRRGMLRVGMDETYYWSEWHVDIGRVALADVAADLIISNDLDVLPLAVHLARKRDIPVMADLHEWAPGEMSGVGTWDRQFRKHNAALCKKYLRCAAQITTVSPGIAALYSRHFGVTCDVITSAPFREDLLPSPLDGNRIRLVHHGVARPERKLENMIELLKQLDARFSLDLMLADGDNAYSEGLKSLAAEDSRIMFRDPVPTSRIAAETNRYDVGLFMLPPTNENMEFVLPNKFFEFVQARLALAIWPNRDMKSYVERFDLGVVAASYDIPSMAAALRRLTVDDLKKFKMSSHEAAAELCAEKNEPRFLHKVGCLLDRQHRCTTAA